MSQDAIELYFWPTPNGQKISIMLEEAAVPYRVHYVNIHAQEQFDPDFLKISPNNKMPAIVDPDGPDGNRLAIFESGAILQYLARKTETLYPSNERRRADVDQWLFWSSSGLGPMSGQCSHFRQFAPEKVPYGIERYTREVARLYGVMERQLSSHHFLAGEYSIADIACFPWILKASELGQNLADFPKLKAWKERIEKRPAVVAGMAVGAQQAAKAEAKV